MRSTLCILLTLILSSQYALAQTSKDKKISEARNQYFSKDYQKACQIQPENYATYPNTPDQAAQVEVTLDKGFSHQFTATDREHYLQIATIHWDEKFVVMVNDDVTLAIKGGDITGENIENNACPAQKRKIYHINTHEWASYLMTITAKAGEKVWITVLPEGNQTHKQ
ncbi:MAG: hypothetical protein ACRC53_05925 [Plesiomonas sp.]|uniref:hypothetical protein n=1 Tax=Plesiomonas sp. TaxID=2486279 RepID=UPI003F2B6959